MYKEFLQQLKKSDNSEKQETFSKQEVINMVKYILMDKFEKSDIALEELKKGDKMNAFIKGLTVVTMLNGAHYIGQDTGKLKKPSAREQSPRYQEIKSRVQARRDKERKENPEVNRDPASQQAGQVQETVEQDNQPRSFRENKIKNFLSAISMNESSGGKNTNHVQMKHGIHTGDSAIGQYGLMPNTVQEMARRSGDRSLRSYSKMDGKGVSDSIKNNPEHEHKIANYMANHLHDKHGGDESKMAYSWNQGHNLTQDHFDTSHKNYKNHDYVQKYNKNRGTVEKTPSQVIKNNKVVSN